MTRYNTTLQLSEVDEKFDADFMGLWGVHTGVAPTETGGALILNDVSPQLIAGPRQDSNTSVANLRSVRYVNQKIWFTNMVFGNTDGVEFGLYLLPTSPYLFARIYFIYNFGLDKYKIGYEYNVEGGSGGTTIAAEFGAVDNVMFRIFRDDDLTVLLQYKIGNHLTKADFESDSDWTTAYTVNISGASPTYLARKGYARYGTINTGTCKVERVKFEGQNGDKIYWSPNINPAGFITVARKTYAAKLTGGITVDSFSADESLPENTYLQYYFIDNDSDDQPAKGSFLLETPYDTAVDLETALIAASPLNTRLHIAVCAYTDEEQADGATPATDIANTPVVANIALEVH